MNDGILRIAARGSKLSLIQATMTLKVLRRLFPGRELRIVKVKTLGDRVRDRPLHQLGVQGAFSKEVNRALLRGEADVAVHSLKDLPSHLDDSIVLHFPLPRGSPRDALVLRKGMEVKGGRLSSLLRGKRIGTSSLRRKALARSLFPHAHAIDLRGNLDTRLGKLERGEYDAIIVSEEGLRRLGAGVDYKPLDPTVFVPAPGQGTIALATLKDDTLLTRRLTEASHKTTRRVSEAERAFLEELGLGCSAPVGMVVLPSRGIAVAFTHAGRGPLWARAALAQGDWRGPAKFLARVVKNSREDRS